MTSELVTRQVAAELTRSRRPPGLSVAVVGSGGEAWSDGFGLADIESGQAAARNFNTMRVYPQLGIGLVAMGNLTRWDHRRFARAATGVG